MVQSGQLRERVTIQQEAAGAADSLGVIARSWSDVATVYARVEPLGAAEIAGQTQVRIENRFRVTLRYRSDFTARDRLLWGTRYLYPLSMVPDERRLLLTAICGERI